MKRLIILILFCASIVNADDRLILAKSNPYVLGSVPVAAGVTWDHILLLNDDAANTTVVNTGGTSKGNWTAIGANTSVLHSTTVKEGTGSFNLSTNGYGMYSAENWTAEKFEIRMWWCPTNGEAATTEVIFCVGDTDLDAELNEIYISRTAAQTDNFKFVSYLSGTGEVTKSTTDANWTNATWYYLKIEIDASVSPWTIAVGWNTDGSDTFTSLTLGSWSANPAVATFNSPVRIGFSLYPPNALFDYFQMRSTE